jgi:hypothetical protein
LASVVRASRHPSLTAPTTISSGTNMSSKNTSLNRLSPVISRSGRMSMPGEDMSTRKYVMPLCLGAPGAVRTSSSWYSAMWPKLVQIFCPVTTKSSPPSSARVDNAARSEPAPGSEKPWHHNSSLANIFGR